MCSPFYNENLVANINIAEASKWVDEIHITECDKSFKYTPHDFCFKLEDSNDKVFYHKLSGDKFYLKPRKFFPNIILSPVSKWMKHYNRNTAWYNEGVSRNNTLWNCKFDDDDIIILSDIDEIIDSRYSNDIISAVNKYGIITIELYFTVFYFNLRCPKFGNLPNYSYRIFVVRGDVLKNKYNSDSDYLRKLGERGKLCNVVKCLGGIKGFHHSWLGDEMFIINKFNSFAHTVNDGFSAIRDNNGNLDPELLKEHFRSGKSIFDNTELVLDNEMPYISGVEKLKRTMPKYFV